MQNRNWPEIQDYLCNPAQLCYARLSRLEEGAGHGQRIIDVNNGTGLAFTVTPDRGMNIVECTFAGIPVVFRTPGGHRSVTGDWLRDWAGGLLTTVGLRNAGGPSGGQGLHGMISSEAAENLSCLNKDGQIEICGTLHEGALFSANLKLERSIRTAYGSNVVTISDKVTNCGEKPQFTEILYHCNFGYPLVSPDMEFDLPEHKVTPRNEEAAAHLAEWAHFPAPLDDFSEHCFLHELPAGADGMAVMRIVNKKLGIALSVSYQTDGLPRIVEWKKPSRNAYVLGLEPTNASLGGCEYDQANGYGRILAPGESAAYFMQIKFESLD